MGSRQLFWRVSMRNAVNSLRRNSRSDWITPDYAGNLQLKVRSFELPSRIECYGNHISGQPSHRRNYSKSRAIFILLKRNWLSVKCLHVGPERLPHFPAANYSIGFFCFVLFDIAVYFLLLDDDVDPPEPRRSRTGGFPISAVPMGRQRRRRAATLEVLP